MILRITYKVGGVGFTATAENIAKAYEYTQAIIEANLLNFPDQEETLSEYMAILAQFKDGKQLMTENHIFKIEMETPENPPLTLAELDGMVGEPLYITPAEKDPDWKPCWVICMEDYVLVHSTTSESRVYTLRRNEDYGKTWMAYRHRLER